MTEEVAKTLVGLLGHISGVPLETYRGDTEKVESALVKALDISDCERRNLWARFKKGAGVMAAERKESEGEEVDG